MCIRDRYKPITRVAKFRLGVILDKNSGALLKIARMVKSRIGSPLGSGKQYMPWIHIDDLCELYIKGIEDKQYNGIYNAVSNEHITNFTFSKRLSKLFRKPFIPFMAPKTLLRLILGEMSTIILNGSRVSAHKIKQAGFKFKFENLDKALKNLK